MIYLTHYRTASTELCEPFEDIAYPQRVHWFPELYNRTSSGLFYVPHRLADMVIDPQFAETLRKTGTGKTAFILASGNAHFAGITLKRYPENRLNYVYKFLPFTLTQVYAGRIAQMCGAADLVTTDASACASSLKVLMEVQHLIRLYGFDRVMVLAVEDAISNTVLDFFGESKAVLTLKDEEDGTLPSAFDSRNYGFHIGQGAAFAVFESARAVESQGVTPHARLLGAYSASEVSSNAIGQRSDGEGFIKAITGAFGVSGVEAGQVRIVKTHGTGTASNNAAESAALAETLKDFVATSYKQKIGHTMGASGLLETLLLFNDMKGGIIPAIANRTDDDPVFLSRPVTVPDGLVLSLASGMGNIYSAAVWSKI